MSVSFFPKRRLPLAWRRNAIPTWAFVGAAAANTAPAAPGGPATPAAGIGGWLEQHGSRVAWISEQMALALGLAPAEAASIAAAARLHDIGKHLLPPELIDKPGQLTPADWGWMRRHPELGASALLATSNLTGDDRETAVAVTLLHHERWDGLGYPCGLESVAIPLCARIVAVADVFDALISERPYKRAWGESEAFEYVLAGSGTQFDPACVTAFLGVYLSLADGWRQGAEAAGATRPALAPHTVAARAAAASEPMLSA